MRQLLVLAAAIAMFACAATAAAGPTAGAAKVVKCGGKKATIKGTKKANRLKGTRRADVIAGLGGNDTIKGLAGNDIACGGDGKDKLFGNGGRDTLIGGKGRDDCRGGPGKDKIKSCETGDVKPPPGDVVLVAPTITMSSGSAAFVEGAGPAPVDSGLSVTDLDSLALTGATVQIASNHAAAQDVLAFTASGGISGAFSPASGTLTLTGTASVSDYQSALRSVTYSNSSDTPSTATRTLIVRVTDASAQPSNSGARDVTVTATNDPPAVTTSAGSLGYAEGDPPQVIDPGVSVADPDDTNLEGAEVRISAGFTVDDDKLWFDDQNGISGTYDSGTGVLTLTGTATVAQYQTALRSVRYEGLSAGEGDSKTISFRADDGDGYGAAATKDVTVGPPNTAPTVDADPTATDLGYSENDGAVAVSPDLTVTDPDSGQAGATVSISGNHDATQDSLGFTDQNGITGAYDSGTGVLTLTGTASTADYQTALRSVTYTNSSENPSTASRTVSFQTTDTHSVPSNTDTRDIDITSINDGPAAVDDTGTTGEDSILNVSAPGVLGNDTDPEADTLTVTELNGSTTLTGAATGGGTVTIDSDGSYSFDPGTDFQDLATGTARPASRTQSRTRAGRPRPPRSRSP
jgi:Bacterial cadherin-like domain/RTX calcium-binding nonapeptide repeat (4 copies)